MEKEYPETALPEEMCEGRGTAQKASTGSCRQAGAGVSSPEVKVGDKDQHVWAPWKLLFRRESLAGVLFPPLPAPSFHNSTLIAMKGFVIALVLWIRKL